MAVDYEEEGSGVFGKVTAFVDLMVEVRKHSYLQFLDF